MTEKREAGDPPVRSPVVEVLDPQIVRALAAKSGAERLAIAFDMAESARAMLLAHLRASHPDWDESQVERETARRLSHGAA